MSEQIILEENSTTFAYILNEYKGVVIESIVSSFGLDFLFVKDQNGGDVDTIHNVRTLEGEEQFKNKKTREIFENRTDYNNGKDYKKTGTNYQKTQKSTRDKYRETGIEIKDEYEGGNLAFLGHAKGANPKRNAELDHVISAKAIHDDPAIALASNNESERKEIGKKISDDPSNLAFTNKSLNASMKEKNIPDYIKEHPELSEETKKRMMNRYNRAVKNRENILNQIYYTSSKFRKDLTFAATNTAMRMGTRQAIGLIMTEISLSVFDEIKIVRNEDDFNLKKLLEAIGNRIQKAYAKVKEKYKDIFSKFLQGAVAGALSSLTTTLTNIFFTTSKNTIKIIRESWTSIVSALKVLLLNSDNLMLGARIAAAIKILSVGASVVAGTLMREILSKTALTTVPFGQELSTTCGAIVSGLMSTTFLYILDKNEKVQMLIEYLNKVHTIEFDIAYYKEQVKYFENYAAELMEIDIEKFAEDIKKYKVTDEILGADSPEKLEIALDDIIEKLDIKVPWKEYENFDAFMLNNNGIKFS